MKKTPSSPGQTVMAGGLGGALGILVVMLWPEGWYVFTPTTAAVATGAFGVVFNYFARYLPPPPN